MRFLIQKIGREVRHDFSFTLLESVRYQNWIRNMDDDIKIKYIDYIDFDKENWNWWFKSFHQHYFPIGSVEFVLAWFKRFHDHVPKPINVPEELFHPRYCRRPIINGNHIDIENLVHGKWFVKSATQFKRFAEVLEIDDNHSWNLSAIPAGHYQMSEYIDIKSEWRTFVYQDKLVGLQNYSGDFDLFPNVSIINEMIKIYKSAPIAYTLDIGVNDHNTFVIEVHDFFSCGLYGFADHNILPFMFNRWFHEYLNKIK